MSKVFLNKLLEYYALNYDEYLAFIKDISYSSLPSFKNFKDIEKIKEYFIDAIINHKKIMIYGDYDCDGIMSISIMAILFKQLNADFDYYIPLRDSDGYGLNKNKIDQFYKEKYDIILCVDNGISLFDEIEYANSLGMDVIVFDHHTIIGNIPNAKFILHPELSNFGDINLSAGAVCFYFSYCVLGHIDDYLLTLGGISLISDMMPLKSYNRNIVRLMLKNLNLHRYKNIMLLANNPKKIDENVVGLSIAPKINAIGRLVLDQSNKKIIEYFFNIENENTYSLNSWIEEINNKRKEIVTNFIEEQKYINSHSIVLKCNIEEGVLGLIANKLLNKYNLPAIILCNDKNNPEILKGSIRSKNGLDVIDSFNELDRFLLKRGGHNLAGGLSIKEEDFSEFSFAFNEYAKNHPFVEVNEKAIDIDLDDVNEENYNIIETFAPFGQENKEPIFKISNFPISSLRFSKDKKHIITPIKYYYSSIVYFNYDPSILSLNYIDIIGKISINEYNNKTTYQFKVEKIEKND